MKLTFLITVVAALIAVTFAAPTTNTNTNADIDVVLNTANTANTDPFNITTLTTQANPEILIEMSSWRTNSGLRNPDALWSLVYKQIMHMCQFRHNQNRCFATTSSVFSVLTEDTSMAGSSLIKHEKIEVEVERSYFGGKKEVLEMMASIVANALKLSTTLDQNCFGFKERTWKIPVWRYREQCNIPNYVSIKLPNPKGAMYQLDVHFKAATLKGGFTCTDVQVPIHRFINTQVGAIKRLVGQNSVGVRTECLPY